MLIRDLESPDDVTRWTAEEELQRAGSYAVEPLIEVLNDGESSSRGTVIEILGNIGDERAVTPLVSVLDENDRELREKAVRALGEITVSTGSEPGINALLRGLEDEDEWVRRTAAEYLGQIKDERAVDPLISHLESDEAELVRSQAAMSLGWIGDERAVEPLIRAMNSDEDELVRSDATRALGDIGGDRVFETFASLLETGEDEFARANAASQLVYVDSERAMPYLERARRYDESVIVRKAVVESLGSWTFTQAAKESSPLVKHSDEFEKGLSLLIEALNDENEVVEVREAAAWSLFKIARFYENEDAENALLNNRNSENATLKKTISGILYELDIGIPSEPIEVIEEAEPIEVQEPESIEELG